MQNHISFKFLAIILCALLMLSTIASAAAIGALAYMDLYNNSAEDVYETHYKGVREGFAYSLAFRFASIDIGKCSSILVDQYYDTSWYYFGTFRWGSFAYAIRDSRGNVLETSENLDLPGAEHFEIPVVNGNFLCVVPDDYVSRLKGEQPAQQLPELPPPPESAEKGITSEEAAVAEEIPPEPAPSTQSITLNQDYSRFADEAYRKNLEQMDSIENIFPYEYYDYMDDEMKQTYLTYGNTSEYTVDLYLLPDAMQDYQVWQVLRGLWGWRNYFFLIMGISMLLCGSLIVYLCCVAGRRPGTRGIRPGALNRTPLDLYLTAAAGLILGLQMMNLQMIPAMFRRSLLLAAFTAGISGFLVCLLVVALIFACGAQFKVPDGYWWKNTLVGRSLLLGKKVAVWLWKLLEKMWYGSPAAFRWAWAKLRKTAAGAYAIGRRGLLGIWEVLRSCGEFFFTLYKRIWHVFPLTWQWLLTALIVVFDLFLTISTGNRLIIVLGLLVAAAIVIYGAVSFGILLDNARRMHRGDLETKIDGKYLVGSFQDFAEELNGLADVAVVAAKKQLNSERMKTELITNVSHDIKTPLTSIINYVDLLKLPHTEQEQAEYLEVLSRQSGRMKKLIDDLMELSKAATGNMNVEIVRLNAGEAVSQAIGEFSDKLERAELTPVFRQPEEEVSMMADGRLAWRAMSNLLVNAVKYALPGTRIYIDLMELDHKVIISMKNISKEALSVDGEELLERFVRGDSSRNTEGIGLGLNIAKTLMELQNGQLELLVDGDLFKATLIFPGV